jgi:hypothetical protein
VPEGWCEPILALADDLCWLDATTGRGREENIASEGVISYLFAPVSVPSNPP